MVITVLAVIQKSLFAPVVTFYPGTPKTRVFVQRITRSTWARMCLPSAHVFLFLIVFCSVACGGNYQNSDYVSYRFNILTLKLTLIGCRFVHRGQYLFIGLTSQGR
jgi:hypothetical protein